MSEIRRPDGATLYVEVHGARDAEPLVLLEGLGGDIPGWRRTIANLSPALRMIAYDLRGNGRSTMPDEPVTMRDFADDTFAVLDEVGVERAHVYGQSFGGMVAQEIALSTPERVRSLILAATSAGGAHLVASTARAPKDRPYLALYAPGFPERHPEHVAEDLRIGAERPQPVFARRRQWEAMQEFDSYERLPGIRTPTLVLHGTADQLVDPANARILAERIPGAELVLLRGAGHLYHSEQPARADAVVLEFVGRYRDA